MDSAIPSSHIGHPLQLAGIRHYQYQSGKAKGVEVYDIRTGGGLQYAVLKDRCLDIAWASFKGVNISYLCSPEVVAPTYYDSRDDGFLESFAGGLLATCGLASAGAPSRDGDESLGLHGRIGNVPAEEAGFESVRDGGKPGWRIHGRMREAKFFGVHLTLEREIRSAWGENRIRIHDRVRNLGHQAQPFQLLYHINFGYPLLDQDSELVLPARAVQPRNARATEGLEQHLRIEPPQAGYEEQCFYHDLKTDQEGYAYAALLNARLGFGVYEKFRKDTLPRFVQWKQMGQGAYVLGLEPGNCLPDGRSVERERGNLVLLDPGQEAEMEVEIGILDGAEAIDQFRALLGRCR
jgi:hypothetical protein